MERTFLKRIVPLPIRDGLVLGYERFRIRSQDFGKISPILVYQMGKVGSSTVVRSLEAAGLPNPIHHVHCLSDAGIKADGQYYLNLGQRIPRNVRLAEILRRKMENQGAIANYKIITLVREQISRQISDFFENVGVYWPHLLDERGRVKVDEAIKFLHDIFMNYDESADYASTWFDREIKAMFGIDVFSYAFSHDRGFTIIREKNAHVLVMRLEDLDSCFANAMSEFLGVDLGIALLKGNVGKEKMYAKEYATVLKSIVLPESVCARIYSSKYARHFYTETMRNELVRKWSTERN